MTKVKKKYIYRDEKRQDEAKKEFNRLKRMRFFFERDINNWQKIKTNLSLEKKYPKINVELIIFFFWPFSNVTDSYIY